MFFIPLISKLAETRGDNKLQEGAPPIEKKTYQLVISDEGNIKSMEVENLPSNSCKFQPPFIQLVGQLKDTQVNPTDIISL